MKTKNQAIRQRPLMDLLDVADEIRDALDDLQQAIVDNRREDRNEAKAELRRLVRRLPAITRRIMAQP